MSWWIGSCSGVWATSGKHMAIYVGDDLDAELCGICQCLTTCPIDSATTNCRPNHHQTDKTPNNSHSSARILQARHEQFPLLPPNTQQMLHSRVASPHRFARQSTSSRSPLASLLDSSPPPPPSPAPPGTLAATSKCAPIAAGACCAARSARRSAKCRRRAATTSGNAASLVSCGSAAAATGRSPRRIRCTSLSCCLQEQSNARVFRNVVMTAPALNPHFDALDQRCNCNSSLYALCTALVAHYRQRVPRRCRVRAWPGLQPQDASFKRSSLSQ